MSVRLSGFFRFWPLLITGLVFGVAWSSFTVFEDDLDGEHPSVHRPTFSPRPPAAYRLAEPGDTLDKSILYLAAAAIAFSSLGWLRSRHPIWLVPVAPLLAVAWDASTPWPTFDGWHGWNWRVIVSANAPATTRVLLGVFAALLALATAGLLCRARGALAWLADRRYRAGHAAAAFLGLSLIWRTLGTPDVEPLGYWPRWGVILGLLGVDCLLCRQLFRQLYDTAGGTNLPPRRLYRRMLRGFVGCLAAWLVLSLAGRWSIWYHRPLDRLRAVVPGRIYISAMPTPEGLALAQERIGFKTIVNLFDESGDQRSPLADGEARFARERGLRLVSCPGREQAEAFLDESLSLAQDPSAWPILVHCHACMDRSPAWMGLYRFLVQGRPLAEILREIEAHRGTRPKASVSLLYDHILMRRAPVRYAADPSKAVLRRMVEMLPDPGWLRSLPERGDPFPKTALDRDFNAVARP